MLVTFMFANGGAIATTVTRKPRVGAKVNGGKIYSESYRNGAWVFFVK